MEEVVRTVGSYATAIEMAFAASLLLGTWGALYRALSDQYSELVRDVEKLQAVDVLQSQLILEDLPATLSRDHRKWRWWWRVGLVSCVVTALGIYIVAWLVHPDTRAGQWIWFVILAPFAGLICMTRMFYLGVQTNTRARDVTARLRSKADDLKQEERAITRAARRAKPDSE